MAHRARGGARGICVGHGSKTVPRQRQTLWLGLVLVAACSASAETAREEIARLGLDHHPRPVLQREAVQIYGQLALGLSRVPSAWGQGDRGVAPIGGNWIGLQGTETLDHGWAAQFRLEGTLHAVPESGASGLAADRTALVGLSHRRWGALALGRVVQPAYGLLEMVDPLSGGIGAADRLLHTQTPTPGTQDTRVSNAMLWTTAGRWPGLQLSLLTSQPPGGQARAHGAALQGRTGAFEWGLGWQEGPARHTDVVPLVLRHTGDRLQTWLAFTQGRDAGAYFRSGSIGMRLRVPRGPRPLSTVVQLSHRDNASGPNEWQLAAGIEQPLSARTAWLVTGALRSTNGGANRAGGELGLRHRFNL